MRNTDDHPDSSTCTCLHESAVDYVRSNMPPEEALCELADLFKYFSDTTRIKILHALSTSELCVCDIATLLNMTMSAVSHQLRVLKQGRLVKSRKEGKSVFYSLEDEHIQQIFRQGFIHINEQPL